MAILVTGGAGFIGSHTCVTLLEAGKEIVVVDNLCNSHMESLNRVKSICQKDFPFYQVDINDRSAMAAIFAQHEIEAVVHFAGLKAVGESSAIPLAYYHNNVSGTIALCEVMAQYRCFKLVFSSSATVYGDPTVIPIPETSPTSATNPYGRSKLMVEEILTDLQASQAEDWNITLLRYFNPIGAHPSGLIGEDPHGVPNNLLPFVAQVASGRLAKVRVFGSDYDTPDGTGVRDYIHVMDLAKGHLNALTHLDQSQPSLNIFNLGTGQGYSVLEIIELFRTISGQTIPYEITARRPGDIATCYADASKAKTILNWTGQHNLEQMITDLWHWQKNNPNGFNPS